MKAKLSIGDVGQLSVGRRLSRTEAKFPHSLLNKKFAFSLVEIMVGLIVTSVMVAAFAPVITKRVSFGGVALTTAKNKEIKDRLFIFDSSKNGKDGCNLKDGGMALECPFKVPNGVYSINAIIVSAGGGGGASSANNVQSGLSKEYTAASTFTIPEGISELKITSLISGGGGGGGGAKSAYTVTTPGSTTTTTETITPSAEVCAKFDAAYFNGYCITKHNMGDTPGYSIDFSGIHYLSSEKDSSGNYYTCPSKGDCCWHGNTVVTNPSLVCTRKKNGGYSGCDRTVCQFNAAKKLCQRYSYGNSSDAVAVWQLPSDSQVADWKNVINSETSKNHSLSRWMGSDGIMLCGSALPSDATSSDKCSGANKRCDGASCDTSSCTTGACNPESIWLNETGKYLYYMNSSAHLAQRPKTADSGVAASVRCVTSSITRKTTQTTAGSSSTTYNVASGGAGASGAKLLGITIPPDILKNNVGKTLHIEIGTGGSGGKYSDTTSSTTANSGTRGGITSVYIENGGNIVWGVRVYGGFGGSGGYVSSSSHTAGSRGSTTSLAEYRDVPTSRWKTLTNSSQINSIYTFVPSVAGSSGSSSSGYGSSVSGGSGNSMDGYGKGGSGGSSNYSSGGYSGTAGTSGYVSIVYSRESHGLSAGGGGGGSMVRVENITVTPGKTVNIKVGKGGSGGASAGANGSDGGTSSLIYSPLSINFTLNGAKGGKGATTANYGSYGAASVVPASYKNSQYQTAYANGTNGQSGYSSSGTNIGGLGGMSGINSYLKSTFGLQNSELVNACGGLFYSNSYMCLNSTSADAYFSKTTHFTPPNRPYEDGSKEYGSAGSGGGGGGIKLHLPGYTFGKGLNGQDGYIYLWWQSAS